MSRVPVSRIDLFVNDLTGPGGMFGIVHESAVYAMYHVTLMVHVCANAHLTNWICLDCLGGLAKRVGHRWENHCPFCPLDVKDTRYGVKRLPVENLKFPALTVSVRYGTLGYSTVRWDMVGRVGRSWLMGCSSVLGLQE